MEPLAFVTPCKEHTQEHNLHPEILFHWRDIVYLNKLIRNVDVTQAIQRTYALFSRLRDPHPSKEKVVEYIFSAYTMKQEEREELERWAKE